MTNVALVVLDTLRKDYFDEHFDWLPGTRFENAWSTSHWTVPAHASLFTGKYASEVGVYTDATTLDCDDPTLAEQLCEDGYTTRAFSANVNFSKTFQFDRGFDDFEGSWRLQALTENVFNWDQFIVETNDMGVERYLMALKKCVFSDCDTVPSLKRGALLKLRDLGLGAGTKDDGATEALDYIRETAFGDREFLFVNLMEAHTPYNPPDEYRTVEPPELDGLEATLQEPSADPDRIRQAYADSVRYLSDMYKQMFDELCTDFDVILTLSDHGELLGEHDAWEHLYGLYPELTHVPLSIYTSEKTEAIRPESVSLLDVHRTILSLAGIDAPSRGRDLLEAPEHGDFLTEYHGISNMHREALAKKGIKDVDHLETELNGLVIDDYYVHETFDEFEEYGDSPFGNSLKQLNKRVAELDKRQMTEHQQFDDAVIQQLKDLGYA